MTDVAIIGAGVVGCAIARELSRYKVSAIVFEKSEDVCTGTSKANSAIIHAGYDAMPGTAKAFFNVAGNAMMDQLSRDLDFPFKRNGSLVVMYEGDDRAKLEELLERGQKNGVEGLRIIEREELFEMEPNLSADAVAALWAPTAGIVCPFGMTIALAENAFNNGIVFSFDSLVKDISKTADGFRLVIKKHPAGEVEREEVVFTRAVINAAGVYSDVIHNMVSRKPLKIKARRGCYYLLDKNVGNFVSRTIFSLPGEMGKGILTAPTVHGNLIVGPDALDTEDKESVCTTAEELDKVAACAGRNLNNPPLKQVITSFAGLRAHLDNGDFLIGEVGEAPGFFDVAGIESPGLSAAPAIGVHVSGLVASELGFEKNPSFDPIRKGVLNPSKLTMEERNRLIADKPEYGTIICRCEGISEGEIVDAVRRPLGAKSLDGIKRRVRAGMGRCQAGFCSPKVMEILSRELGVGMDSITKSGGDSRLIPEGKLNAKY